MADIYYNSKTNEYVHAPFPEGLVNEVNYDGSIKALLYLLNTECNVSIDKCRKLLSDLTGGQLSISKGMINGLAAEFAKRSEGELRKACNEFLLAPVMHADNTVGRINGENVFVHVCALPDGRALFFFNRKKGHEGVKSTLLKDYQGIIVHDHDTTYYSYGSGHQECCAHILRMNLTAAGIRKCVRLFRKWFITGTLFRREPFRIQKRLPLWKADMTQSW